MQKDKNMPRLYSRRRKPKKVQGFLDDMTKNEVIKSAAKIASKQSNATQEARELKKLDPELRQSVANFLRYRLDMTEQEFLNQVNGKLSRMVVAILMEKFLTVSGRPSNITASANVTLGASDMSPDQVRTILKGASKSVKQQPTDASEQKVVDIEESK